MTCHPNPPPESYDPETLDQALAQLASEAQAARDCYLMGDDKLGAIHFDIAIHHLSVAVQQISLKNRK